MTAVPGLRSPPFQCPCDRRHNQQNQEHEEKNLCDTRSGSGDTTETKNPGHDGEDEKNDCPA